MAKFIYTIDGEEGLVQAHTAAKAFDLIQEEHGVLPDTLTIQTEDRPEYETTDVFKKPTYNTGIAKAMETLICASILKDFTPATVEDYTRESLSRDAEKVWLKLSTVFDEHTEELMAAFDGVMKRIKNIVKE